MTATMAATAAFQNHRVICLVLHIVVVTVLGGVVTDSWDVVQPLFLRGVQCSFALEQWDKQLACSTFSPSLAGRGIASVAPLDCDSEDVDEDHQR